MTSVSWNDIPPELQHRVLTQGVGAVGDLASWAYENRPGWARNDDLHDLLCALIVFLLRGAARKGRKIESLPAILTAIAYRQKCQRFRDKSSEKQSQLPWEPEGDLPSPFAHLARLELRDVVQTALARLNGLEREAILRKHVLGESYRQIARALYGTGAGGKHEKRISVMLTRARQKLRERLQEKGS